MRWLALDGERDLPCLVQVPFGELHRIFPVVVPWEHSMVLDVFFSDGLEQRFR